MHTVIKNLKLFFHELLCTFLYKIERNWQRDVEKFTVNTKANFFTVSMCGCLYSITQHERKEIHQPCVAV